MTSARVAHENHEAGRVALWALYESLVERDRRLARERERRAYEERTGRTRQGRPIRPIRTH